MLKQILLNIVLLGSILDAQAGPREAITKVITQATASITTKIDTRWSNLVAQALTEPHPGRVMQYANQFAVCSHGTPTCSTSGHCVCRHLKSNLSPDEILAAHKYLESVTRK